MQSIAGQTGIDSIGRLSDGDQMLIDQVEGEIELVSAGGGPEYRGEIRLPIDSWKIVLKERIRLDCDDGLSLLISFKSPTIHNGMAWVPAPFTSQGPPLSGG